MNESVNSLATSIIDVEGYIDGEAMIVVVTFGFENTVAYVEELKNVEKCEGPQIENGKMVKLG